jgi:hypothetical protein
MSEPQISVVAPVLNGAASLPALLAALGLELVHSPKAVVGHHAESSGGGSSAAPWALRRAPTAGC